MQKHGDGPSNAVVGLLHDGVVNREEGLCKSVNREPCNGGGPRSPKARVSRISLSAQS